MSNNYPPDTLSAISEELQNIGQAIGIAGASGDPSYERRLADSYLAVCMGALLRRGAPGGTDDLVGYALGCAKAMMEARRKIEVRST